MSNIFILRGFFKKIHGLEIHTGIISSKPYKRTSLVVRTLGKKVTKEIVQDEILTIADIGAKHEYGIGVPKRSFLKDYFEENASNIHSVIVRLISDIDENLPDKLGLYFVGKIQTRISNGISPPLTKSTLLYKSRYGKGLGKSTPLILTGQLRSSITYQVHQKNHGGQPLTVKDIL